MLGLLPSEGICRYHLPWLVMYSGDFPLDTVNHWVVPKTGIYTPIKLLLEYRKIIEKMMHYGKLGICRIPKFNETDSTWTSLKHTLILAVPSSYSSYTWWYPLVITPGNGTALFHRCFFPLKSWNPHFVRGFPSQPCLMTAFRVWVTISAVFPCEKTARCAVSRGSDVPELPFVSEDPQFHGEFCDCQNFEKIER